MGGSMDGMDDLDTPAPPMGFDDMGGEDPNAMGDEPMGADGGMGDDPMGDPMGGENDPNADPMGGMDDPNADPMGDDGGTPNGNDELSQVVGDMSTEQQAAVLKYAKSIKGESISRIDRVIKEVINDINREEKPNDLPKEYLKIRNPFKSPFAE